MKNYFLIVIFFIVSVFVGCKITTRKYSETEREGFIKYTKSVSYVNLNYCRKTTRSIVKDTLTQKIVAKEFMRYNCRGAWSAVVYCKKWKLENDKLVVQKNACKTPKY